MRSVIAYITDFEHPAVRGLILKVEGPVLRVGQLVVDVVSAVKEWTIKIAGRPASGETACSLLQVGQIGEECGSRCGRRGWQSRAERLVKGRALTDGDRLNKWRREGDAERAVKSRPRTRRK